MQDGPDGNNPSPATGDGTSIAATLHDRDEALLTVVGELTGPAVARLRAMLRGLSAAGARYLVVDLSGVTECEHSVRRVFTTAIRRLQLVQGWMMLLQPPAILADLDTMSLETVFATYRRAVEPGAASRPDAAESRSSTSPTRPAHGSRNVVA
jgi:anti-anti-sigma regulatory factor